MSLFASYKIWTIWHFIKDSDLFDNIANKPYWRHIPSFVLLILNYEKFKKKTVSKIHNQSIGIWSFLWSSLPNPNKKSITHKSHVVPAFWRLFFWWHAWLGHDNAPNRATFFVQKKGSAQHRLSDSHQPTVQALESLQWSQKAMFFYKNTQHCLSNSNQLKLFIQLVSKTLTHPSKKYIDKNCCFGATVWTVKFVLHLILSSLSIKSSTTKFLPSLNPPFLVGIPFYR